MEIWMLILMHKSLLHETIEVDDCKVEYLHFMVDTRWRDGNWCRLSDLNGSVPAHRLHAGDSMSASGGVRQGLSSCWTTIHDLKVQLPSNSSGS